MSFEICKFCEPRPAKNPRLLNYFQLAHTGYKSMDFISRGIYNVLCFGVVLQPFRGQKMALSGSNILIKLELEFFLNYILKLKLYSLHFTSFTSFKKCCSIYNYNFLQRSKMECLNKWNLCWGMQFLLWLSIFTQVFFLMFTNIFKVYVSCSFGRISKMGPTFRVTSGYR